MQVVDAGLASFSRKVVKASVITMENTILSKIVFADKR